MPDAHKLSLRHVFVYGTLRAGGSNDIRRHGRAVQAIGIGSIDGTLYDLGAYPGATLQGQGRVLGEIYAITPEVEAALDRLEGIRPDDNGEYRRRSVRVLVEERGEIDCLVYEIHPDRLHGAPRIESGDWFWRGCSMT